MNELITTAAFIETLPAWVWVYQGHAHPAIRFFYRVPRETLYALINCPHGNVNEASGWAYAKVREAGIKADRILAFVHGEPVTLVAIETML